MPHHCSPVGRPSRTRYFLALAMVAAGALMGCSLWDLGPEPDNRVGPGNMEAPRLLTDSNLQAVTPEVAGDHEAGSTMVPGSTPTSLPSTMTSTGPASTQA